MTYLRMKHLFDDAPATDFDPNDRGGFDPDDWSDFDPNDWRWTISICQPFTALEMALLKTNDHEFIRRAFPVLAPLIETEIDAWYNSLGQPPQHTRPLLCANVTRH